MGSPDSVGGVTDVDDFFEHFGVKGMKWGVRKQGPTAKAGPPAKAAPQKATRPADMGPKPGGPRGGRIQKRTEEQKNGTSSKSKHDISDEDLRKAINRIDMERKFATLTKAPPGKKEAAIKFVTDILVDVGKQQAKVLLTGVATKQLAKRGIVAPKVDKK